MSSARLLAAAAVCSFACSAIAGTARVTVAHDLKEKRAGEVIVIPFEEVLRVLPDARMYHLQVRDPQGKLIPSQITNYEHDHRGFQYDDLVFQYDLPAAGSPATFTLETIQATTPPIEPRVFARLVPERFDDFAWENDRIAHRMYGSTLNTPAAGGERLRGSGIDIWGKRVPYLIVDRWYAKGHDQFHKDGEGEGLDLYSIGGSRGGGGTGVWRDGKLFTSDNFASARVLANGPLRAVFELTYAPWDIGDGRTVSEVKRFTVDADRNFDAVESVFKFEGNDDLTIAIGITQHRDVPMNVSQDDQQHWLNTWESSNDGGLGVAVILAKDAATAGFASEPIGSAGAAYGNRLILTRVKSGQPLKYWTGAGWDRSGQFASREAWDKYVQAFVQRTRAPITAKVEAVR
jgi:pectinesterase